MQLTQSDYSYHDTVGRVLYDEAMPNDNEYFDCDCLPMFLLKPALPEQMNDPSRRYYTVPDLQTLPIWQPDQVYQAAYIPSQSKIAVLDEVAFQVLRGYTRGSTAPALSLALGTDVTRLTDTFLTLGFISSDGQQSNHAATSAQEPLVAWLHITNACNLRCTYCYIHKSDEHMTWETGKQVIDSILETAYQYHYRSIVLKYAGGEPLLQLALIRRLHKYALDQIDPGVQLRGTILSNGIGVTARRAKLIKDMGLNLTISLDSLGDAHNEQRPFVNGEGSAMYVLRGITNALNAGIRPSISLTLTRSSCNSLLETIDWILANDLPFNIHYYRDHVPGSSQQALHIADAELIGVMKRLLARIERHMPRRSLLGSLVDYSNLSYSHQSTCLAGRSYLVYGHRGTVSACQMMMDEPHATIDDADPLRIMHEHTASFFRPVDEKEGCRECEWRYWCTGGCPVQTFRATGRTDVKSPYCAIYKALFPEIIRLEALRILRFH